MDQAAQTSCSHKIGLAWRYNSFSLYMSCQINLASSGAILVVVTQSVEETTSPVCPCLSPESTWDNTCMTNAVMPSLHHDTFGNFETESMKQSRESCWDDELISGVYHCCANNCLWVCWCCSGHVCTLTLHGWFFSQRLNPTCTWQSLLSDSRSCVSVETRLFSLLNGTAKIERMGIVACQNTFRGLIVCHNAWLLPILNVNSQVNKV